MMEVIINGAISPLPAASKPLKTEKCWLLNFLACLQYSPFSPPLGDFLSRYHQLPGRWLAMVPIYWEASHNDSHVAAYGQDFQFSEEESYAWFKEIAQFLKEENMGLHYHSANLWLVNVDNKPPLLSIPPSGLQQSMTAVLQQMDATMYWQRLLTELQMFLSNHPLNNLRPNQLPVNGVWVYGEGDLVFSTTKLIKSNDEQLLKAFPQQVKRLSLEIPLKKNTIIVIAENSSFDYEYFLLRYGNQSIHWFWNNAAYATKKRPWWNKWLTGKRSFRAD